MDLEQINAIGIGVFAFIVLTACSTCFTMIAEEEREARERRHLNEAMGAQP